MKLGDALVMEKFSVLILWKGVNFVVESNYFRALLKNLLENYSCSNSISISTWINIRFLLILSGQMVSKLEKNLHFQPHILLLLLFEYFFLNDLLAFVDKPYAVQFSAYFNFIQSSSIITRNRYGRKIDNCRLKSKRFPGENK